MAIEGFSHFGEQNNPLNTSETDQQYGGDNEALIIYNSAEEATPSPLFIERCENEGLFLRIPAHAPLWVGRTILLFVAANNALRRLDERESD